MCGSCNFQNSKLTTFSSSPGAFPCQGEVPRAGPWVGSAVKSANTDDSALVCQSDCSGALPARGSLCSRQQQRTSALCSFSPVPSQVEKGKETALQGHRGFSTTGGWLPQNRPQFQCWDIVQVSRRAGRVQETVPRLSQVAPAGTVPRERC